MQNILAAQRLDEESFLPIEDAIDSIEEFLNALSDAQDLVLSKLRCDYIEPEYQAELIQAHGIYHKVLAQLRAEIVPDFNYRNTENSHECSD